MLIRLTRYVLVAVAVSRGVSPWFADVNASHIFDPARPPHAVFQGGHILVSTSLSSAFALVVLLRDERGGPRRPTSASARKARDGASWLGQHA